MTWIITRLCRDCLDLTCLDVCPVECIVERRDGAPDGDWPNQLYIAPSECIDCGACEPECPWDAIFEEVAVPPALSSDIALNYAIEADREHFEVPTRPKKAEHPTEDERAANRHKWGVPDDVFLNRRPQEDS